MITTLEEIKVAQVFAEFRLKNGVALDNMRTHSADPAGSSPTSRRN